MKPRNYISGLLVILAITFTMPSSTFAHPGHRPHWVDSHCCDAGTRYVFFPDHNFYYDLEREVYIYPSGGMWLFSHDVPSMFIHLDLAYAPIIELDIHIDRPFIHNHDHVVWYRTHRHDHYVRYYDGHRYYRDHPDYYRHGHKSNHGNHYGHYKKGHDHGDNYGHRRGGDDHKGHYKDGDKHKNHYGNHKNGNGNHRGDGHGNGNHGNNGNGNYKKYEKKSNNDHYVKRTNEHRGNGSGNGREGNGRSGSGRGR